MRDGESALTGTISALIGSLRLSEPFRTGSHRAAQFAAVIGDRRPDHAAGRIAPPTFAHVPAMQSMVEVVQAVTRDFVLHGEHDFVFHAPIRPGRILRTRSVLAGLRGTRAGLALHVRSDTETLGGEPVCTQWSTLLWRNGPPLPALGEAPPGRDEAGPGREVTSHHAIGPELTEAYAEAARDYSPYTLDAEAARAAGLPGPIVHGMLTLSLAATSLLEARADDVPALRLRRLACRFAAPLASRAGERLAVTQRADGTGRVAFAATDASGRAVLTRGHAEFAP